MISPTQLSMVTLDLRCLVNGPTVIAEILLFPFIHTMVRSLSGLQPARKHAIKFKDKKKNANKLEFQVCIKPAPMSIKPLSSLVNPFKRGCSIFCNHPTNNIGLKMAIEKTKRKKMDEEREAEIMGQILEDIICRYGARRSVDTDTGATSPEIEGLPPPPPPRPHLVLNLRRTLSQETGRTSVGLQSTFSPSPSSQSGQMLKNNTTPSPVQPPEPTLDSTVLSEQDEEESGEMMKRRGKIRKKKKKSHQTPDKGEKEVTDLIEPNETLVSTCKGDEWDYESDEYTKDKPGIDRGAQKNYSSQATPPLLQSDIFDYRTLRHLRRSLSASHVEAEFRKIWRRVLEEALGSSDVLPKDEIKMGDEIKVPPCEPEIWISYPRTFSRAAARFDLPTNKTLLNDMTPLEYLREYVANTKMNMLLYEYIYKKYTSVNDHLTSEVLIDALGEVMGRPFTKEEECTLTDLIDLQGDPIDYRTWLGICAITERFYGEQFSTGKDMDMGKRQVIEKVDFESLEKRMNKLQLNPKISRLLRVISTS